MTDPGASPGTDAEPMIAVPARLAPLAALLVEYAAKEIAQRTGTRSALRDLPELQAILLPAAASARGRVTSTMEPRARPEELTTAQAADVMGVSERRVREHARTARLIARKVAARDWLIDADSARDYARGGTR
ncbi:MAG TPA: hypothetical protein VG142_11860 [Trebonia sp.]|jgi:hypothetical protein|nr:hypothetical protein [Trebonia sp.]